MNKNYKKYTLPQKVQVIFQLQYLPFRKTYYSLFADTSDVKIKDAIEYIYTAPYTEQKKEHLPFTSQIHVEGLYNT